MRSKQILKSLHSLLDWKQKITFLFIMLIMVLSSVLTQLTPKAIGWLTDDILSQAELDFPAIFPILFFILIVNIVNEIIKILRRILVEDIATKTEKKARGLVISSLLKAPLAYFKENMTGNIHGRLNRCLEGTVKLKKENGMTVISIAHRLTTLKNCDNIIVMDHGKVVQSGKYPDLINKAGIFSDMYYGKLK